jgi:hypothetical protein
MFWVVYNCFGAFLCQSKHLGAFKLFQAVPGRSRPVWAVLDHFELLRSFSSRFEAILIVLSRFELFELF